MPPAFALPPAARVLIVKLSALGDVAQALPAATALRRRYPAAHITWAAERRAAALVSDHPAIDRVVCFPEMSWSAAGGGWARDFTVALRAIRSAAYDVCLDLQGLLKSAVVVAASRAPHRLVTARAREGSQLVARRLPSAGHIHAVGEYLQAAGYLGAPVDAVDFGLEARPDAAAAIARRLESLQRGPGEPLIVVNPSSSTAKKTWPIERWADLCARLATIGTVILTGGATQRDRHGALARDTDGVAGNFTGLPLEESIALLARCAVHVAPDTGTAHIAAALGRPVVAVFGPTPVWRLAPYGSADLVVTRNDLCGRMCPRPCWRGRQCLTAITAADVVRQVERALSSARGAARDW